MLIKGKAKDIIFRNEENGYSVIVIEVNGLPIVATGEIPIISVGESIECEGEYKNNARYGLQFEIKKITASSPDTEEGLRRYLSSGIIKGVGEVLANAIVDRFGLDSTEVIEFRYKELSKIRGISTKKAKEIHEQFIEKTEPRKAVMFLQNYNISLKTAIKIYGKYKDKTQLTVKNNPYKLIEDIEGIGFLTADKIARSMGIQENDELRIKAAIIHSLKEAGENDGHTFLCATELKAGTEELLGMPQNEVKFLDVLKDLAISGSIKLIYDKAVGSAENEIEKAISSGRADDEGRADKAYTTADDDRERDFSSIIVMLRWLYFSEKGIASRLATLANSQASESINIEQEIAEFEKANGIEFHKAQRQAIADSLKSGVAVITGGPGTGKTTIIKCILSIIKKNGHMVSLLAPTGRAAKRMTEAVGFDAKTIHRALKADKNGSFYYNESTPMEETYFIVDEVSMVDCSLMYNLLKAIRNGSKLLLIGDKDQLPSVGAGNVLSDILNSGFVQVSHLTQVYRQAESSRIITNAHLINGGKKPVLNDRSDSSDFFFLERNSHDDIYSATLDMLKNRLPKFLGIDASKIQILAPMKNGTAGVYALNRGAQELLNPFIGDLNEIKYGETVFRLNDKVMQTSNNYDTEWTRILNGKIETDFGVYNGDIGSIIEINPASKSLTVEFDDGRTAQYLPDMLKELTLAYAITIHKSQGCEFDAVVLPVGGGNGLMLNRNLLYTAVTRAKRLVMLIGSEASVMHMVKNNFSAKRNSRLKDFLKISFSSLLFD